jgi:hypothetical protein
LRRPAFFIAGLLFSLPALAATQFERNCTVFADPSPIAVRLCRKRAGDPILEAKASRAGFVRVDTGDCLGYVRESCLAEEAQRRPSSETASAGSGRVRVGLSLQGDGLFGKVSGATTGTDGFGFAAAALVQIPLFRTFRLTLKPTYQYLSLSRTVALGSVLSEPSDLEFTQRIPYAGVGLIGSFQVVGQARESSNEWWIDLGADYLFPLSGRQTDSSGDTVGFHPTAKLVVGYLGASTRVPLSASWDMGGALHAFYNLAATGGSSFYGLRLALSLTVHL